MCIRDRHNGISGINIYHVPIVPIFIKIFLVGLLQIVLSCVLSSNLKKETLVEMCIRDRYGYWGNKGNACYLQFRHQVMVTGAVSTVICMLFLTFLLYWKKKEDACHQKILDQLEEIMIRFRENKFDDLLKTENQAELEKLNDQLEAIGHHIQLLKDVYKRQLYESQDIHMNYLRKTESSSSI